MTHNEKKYEKYLRKWLKDSKKWKVFPKQKRFQIKYSEKGCQPDIIATKKRAQSIYFFEVKDTSSIRGIGQTFGQIIASKLTYMKMNSKDRRELLRNWGKKNPRLHFCVAFTKKTFKKSKIISEKLRLKYFKDIGLCFIKGKNSIEFKFHGKPEKLMK